jgi:hypothetical protein
MREVRRGVALRLHHQDLANGTGVDFVNGLAHLFDGSDLLAGSEDSPWIALGRRQHHADLFRCDANRFFAVHVLAAIQCSDRHFGVQLRRRGDEDGIDVLAVDDGAPVRIGFRVVAGRGCCRFVQTVRLVVAEGGDGSRGGLLQNTLQQIGTTIADANQGRAGLFLLCCCLGGEGNRGSGRGRRSGGEEVSAVHSRGFSCGE